MKNSWKRWFAGIASGAFLMQTGGCAEIATGVTAFSSVITATGVLYIVGRVLRD